jgi:hypothetical protein
LDAPGIVRRVYLDLIGPLPTTSEAATFFANDGHDKRKNLVDRLLTRANYAEYWARKWADILRRWH